MPWEGECNQCGLCCTQVIRGVPARCEHLRIVSADEAVCEKYLDGRRRGMKCALLDAENRLVGWSDCTPVYPHHLSKDTVLPSKCGYRWAMDKP
ncbi:hypothetical protein LCGC14_1382870 [marine sediment metagenome]|uniref:Uncharacterized protein n=1 Tax=marine sediment metagenome TaxID=412755 RepID=A0A0F9K257_9ZZZZ